MTQTNRDEKHRPNKTISIICGINALLSILAFFLPLGVIDHEYQISMYKFAIGGIQKEFFGASDFVSILFLLSLILSSVLLLLWAIFSFRRITKAIAIGIFASIYYIVQAIVFSSLVSYLMSTHYIGSFFVVCYFCISNIVLAILQYKKYKKGLK